MCHALVKILVTPATNAVGERSASALRRMKTCLRSTMLQNRLKQFNDDLCAQAKIEFEMLC